MAPATSADPAKSAASDGDGCVPVSMRLSNAGPRSGGRPGGGYASTSAYWAAGSANSGESPSSTVGGERDVADDQRHAAGDCWARTIKACQRALHSVLNGKDGRFPKTRTEGRLCPVPPYLGGSDQGSTLTAILGHEQTSQLMLLPTHHISSQGGKALMGFRYECSAHRLGDALAIMRTIFLGHATTECQEDEAAIMRILISPEANRQKMMEFIQELRENYCPAAPADLSCISDNVTSVTHVGLMQATDMRSMDRKAWDPEAPETIGIYHAYIRGYAKAADQFCFLVINVGSAPSFPAVPTTDTVEHDIASLNTCIVTVHNFALDTTRLINGILCQMHTGEGPRRLLAVLGRPGERACMELCLAATSLRCARYFPPAPPTWQESTATCHSA